MDPVTAAGLALAVIGLVPLCATGFQLVENSINASKDAAKAFDSITFQSGTFIAWAEQWKIDLDDQQRSKTTVVDNRRSLLKEHLQSGTRTGPYIIKALVSIANTFRSAKELEKKYGVEVRAPIKDLPDLPPLDADQIVQDATEFIDGEPLDAKMGYMKRRKMKMNIFKSVHFALRGSNDLERLAVEMERYINALMKMCSPNVARNIEMMVFVRILPKREEPEELDDFAQMAKTKSSQKEEDSQDPAVYYLMKSTAIFKKRLKLLDPDKSDIVHDKSFYRHDVRTWEYNNGDGTLAVSRRSRSVRYIEWKSYSKNNGKDSLETEGNIKKLALLLASDAKPNEICTRRCMGIFKDPSNNRYGMIYEPPRYIANFWTTDTQDSAVARFCKPVTLLKLLERSADPDKPESILDLGIRFQLAKTLVQSVLILHAAGWLHKNIRSTSVMFVPARSESGGPSRSFRLDWERPWLCGFGRSRPDQSTSGNPKDRSKPTYYDEEKAEIVSDIYLHPDKRLVPTRQTRQAYDIYSLGCVLLEIGLWQSLESFNRRRFSEREFRDYLRDEVSRELVGQTGAKYASAVKVCLSVTSETSDRESRDILCGKVAAVLEGCSA